MDLSACLEWINNKHINNNNNQKKKIIIIGKYCYENIIYK